MKWGRTTLIVIGAVIVTALGIDAADTFTGNEGTLLSQIISSEKGACPSGMVAVRNVPSVSCVDVYEGSAGTNCPVAEPDNVLGSLRNIESQKCFPESKANAMPWRYISRDLAMQICARAGKRLPTSEEWYTLSLGISAIDESCNVKSNAVSRSGVYERCVSPHGAYDLIGNVWEWVSDDVIDGTYRNSTLPPSGYVAQVDQSGMATLTSQTEEVLFGSDYFWSQATGAYGIIRGGYYDSGTDAGVYTVHADTPPTAASAGVGFRCVR
jgi:formylglycine-generating enzyme required for sulfatase activity